MCIRDSCDTDFHRVTAAEMGRIDVDLNNPRVIGIELPPGEIAAKQLSLIHISRSLRVRSELSVRSPGCRRHRPEPERSFSAFPSLLLDVRGADGPPQAAISLQQFVGCDRAATTRGINMRWTVSPDVKYRLHGLPPGLDIVSTLEQRRVCLLYTSRCV